MSAYPFCTPLAQALGASPEARVKHPGLLLDRFAAYPSCSFADFAQDSGQKPLLDALHRLSKELSDTRPPGPNQERQENADLRDLLSGWEEQLRRLPCGVSTWKQSLLWRLAAHLSRASTLENGALCLHPLYGFPYLPGTGLKGLARAWAETLAAEEEQRPEDVLPPASEHRERIFGASAEHGGAGTVLFLEAWPTRLPRLEVDIVNSHHKDYYAHRGHEGGHDYPPGDWEPPNPTYFLAVASGTTFRFAVAPRESRVCSKDVATARYWLQQGLQDLGAGAKTAAGYGYFGGPEQG